MQPLPPGAFYYWDLMASALAPRREACWVIEEARTRLLDVRWLEVPAYGAKLDAVKDTLPARSGVADRSAEEP